MEEEKKKLILTIIIVVCFGVAAVVTLKNLKKGPGTLESIKHGEEMYWIKCRNPECENEWQMDKKDYFVYLRENQDPMSMMAPAIVCTGCGEEGGYRAEKCEKCGLVFERGAVPNDFADRCPECSFSKTEQRRKETRQNE
ncbi:MAG: hypothetical protein MUO22_01675 [Sedimentisphaerales bacterium]|nr:hypothetical protein [Sedimentisphaerales bacterium]